MPLTSTPPEFLTRHGWPAGSAKASPVVLAGIRARYLQHQTGEGFQPYVLVVPALVARAHQVLDADDRTSYASAGGGSGG